jgi:poly(3-hydroxybutyrate) depolymerase
MRRGSARIAAIGLAALSALASPGGADSAIERHTLVSGGKTRTYFLYVPDAARAGGRVPLLVALHGSGRDGKSLISPWVTLAEKEGIVLAGPDSTDSEHWASPADGPVFLRDLVEELKTSNRDVWQFLRNQSLGADPEYTPYREAR